ncbi:MAG: signal peptidase I [Deltaproteobacteria bacterium]|nr:signal peptidase I [Deltaproteobacteria bacterium]
MAVAAALLLRTFAVEVFRIPSASMAPTLLAGDQVVVWKGAYGLKLPLGGPWLLARPVRRGDVIVFRHPRQPDRDFVKRVVGLPGDVVEVRDGTLHVNGVPQPTEAGGEARYQERSEQSGRWWSDTCLRFLETLARGPVPPPRGAGREAESEAWRAVEGAGVVRHEMLRCRQPRSDDREGPWAPVPPGHLFVLGDNRDRSQDSRSAGGWQVPLDNVEGRVELVLLRWTGAPRIERLFKPIE